MAWFFLLSFILTSLYFLFVTSFWRMYQH